MRGDRPWQEAFLSVVMEFTPHARGSTPYALIAIKNCEVYPACAGIDRRKIKNEDADSGLPRMRGDRP